MENLNSVHLKGTCGMVKASEIGDMCVLRISLAVNYEYKAENGTPIIETTWFDIFATEKAFSTPIDDIAMGDNLDVSGRFRASKYTTSAGDERIKYEVVANSVTRINDVPPEE